MRWLLYGAYGYTGRLIARRAEEEGQRPVLAGRDSERTAELARHLGLDHRSFSLHRPGELGAALADVDLVLNAAGPFSSTFGPMAGACIARGAHYLDITGEIPVFEAARSLDGRAREAGVLLLPGVGLDVVPSDCMAVRAVRRLERANELDLALHSTGGPSPGTLKTMLEGLARPGKMRRDGEIIDVEHGSVRRSIPFADREREGVCIPWGDVSTAGYSTGVPNVRVFMTLPIAVARRAGLLSRLLRVPGVRSLALRIVDWTVSGPSSEERARSTTRIWCEARSEDSDPVRLELVTAGGYTFTARSAVAAAVRVGEGRVERDPVGFQTPATLFGPGFVDEIPGTRWIDA